MNEPKFIGINDSDIGYFDPDFYDIESDKNIKSEIEKTKDEEEYQEI